MSKISNRQICRQQQWKKGIPASSFNEKMGYGDRSKIFHTELANMIDFVMDSPFESDIKDYKNLVYNILEAYDKYFDQSLLALTTKN